MYIYLIRVETLLYPENTFLHFEHFCCLFTRQLTLIRAWEINKNLDAAFKIRYLNNYNVHPNWLNVEPGKI